jgi:hypothetical protein
MNAFVLAVSCPAICSTLEYSLFVLARDSKIRRLSPTVGTVSWMLRDTLVGRCNYKRICSSASLRTRQNVSQLSVCWRNVLVSVRELLLLWRLLLLLWLGILWGLVLAY